MLNTKYPLSDLSLEIVDDIDFANGSLSRSDHDAGDAGHG